MPLLCFEDLKLHNDVDVKEQVIICILKCAYFCLLCLLDLVGQQMVLRTEEQIRREVLHAEGRTRRQKNRNRPALGINNHAPGC
ncbi:hypothetical protein T03_3095 [Trichinella britovi]|uniref:Uncharacterized protein n=1 Tax=Trichinella britovi TaxID=45882 RepID=A0A0V1CCI7_TRIBR|nr:hypothetical protein T03_3095 [Trichinella britovi]